MAKGTGYYRIEYKDEEGVKRTSQRIFADSKSEAEQLFTVDTGYKAKKVKFLGKEYKKRKENLGGFDFWTGAKRRKKKNE